MGDADAGDDAKAEATLEECVRLLSSDSREKKFVGMLLVTRLVPDSDDDATLTRLYNATGFARFVTSMLRAAPAPSGDGAAASDAEAESAEARAAQATASHALALATCAALSKSPEVATDDSMVERLPLFAAAMARKGRYAALPCAAVADACEAATRVVAAEPDGDAGDADVGEARRRRLRGSRSRSEFRYRYRSRSVAFVSTRRFVVPRFGGRTSRGRRCAPHGVARGGGRTRR